jgi:hypothetical protein
METNLKKASCGNCGNQTFEVYKPENEDKLICECTSCKSTSELTVPQPKIKIDFHKDSKGIMHF